MALPPLTPEQRAEALQKAAIARKERAEVKNRLKRGATTLSEVIKDGSTDDVIRAALACAYTAGRRDHSIENADRLRDEIMRRDPLKVAS